MLPSFSRMSLRVDPARLYLAEVGGRFTLADSHPVGGRSSSQENTTTHPSLRNQRTCIRESVPGRPGAQALELHCLGSNPDSATCHLLVLGRVTLCAAVSPTVKRNHDGNQAPGVMGMTWAAHVKPLQVPGTCQV